MKQKPRCKQTSAASNTRSTVCDFRILNHDLRAAEQRVGVQSLSEAVAESRIK